VRGQRAADVDHTARVTRPTVHRVERGSRGRVDRPTVMTGVTQTARGRYAGLREHVRATRSDPSLRREADMMAFYLSLTLLTALNVAHDGAPARELLLIIWAATLGLALIHWFALTLAALLVRDPHARHTPGETLLSQTVMAVPLALVASVVVVLAPAGADVLTARLAVALFVAGLVTVEARSAGRPLARALAIGTAALVVTVILATIKLAFA
jgi:hypothetical protein